MTNNVTDEMPDEKGLPAEDSAEESSWCVMKSVMHKYTPNMTYVHVLKDVLYKNALQI